MKRLIILSMLLLSACGQEKVINVGIATPPEIPALPDDLATRASKLPPIKSGKLEDVILDGATTDALYNDVAIRLNSLQDLYNCIRISHNTNKPYSDCKK